jgi:arylsulfatase A-like enzyme
MGWLFRNAGYDTAYAGKWHLPKQLMDEGHGFEILCGMDDPLVTEKSIEFLAREHDKPFLLVASFIQPHGICSVTRFPDPRRKIEIAGLDPDPNDPDYIDKCPALPANFALPQPCPEAVLKHRNETRDIAPENRPSFWAPEERLNAAAHWPDEYYRYYRRAYYRMVENVDQQIGQVLQALRDSGQEDNTLVVFSSDHGEMMGAHTLVMKRFFYEEAVRIPLLVSFKGRIAPGQVVDSALVSNGLDLLPTLCDYSGVTPPPGLEGASLRPLLEGAAPDDWRTELVIECDNPDSRMLHTGRYKYSHYATGANPEELYDLEQDPGELHNVVSDPEYAQVLADCRARLAAWRQAHGDIPVPSAPEAT